MVPYPHRQVNLLKEHFKRKIDLSEAEAVMDIISAKGKTQARAALACHDGKISKEIFKVNKILVDCAAHLSAWADYPEEDIPQVDNENLGDNLNNAKLIVENLLKNYDAGMTLKEVLIQLLLVSLMLANQHL